MMVWKMIFLFQGCGLKFHVNLPGCSIHMYTSYYNLIWFEICHQHLARYATPQVLCGNTCKTQEKEVLSWCILLIGIPNVMFSPVLSAEQLPNARAHVHLWLHRWPAKHRMFQWKPTPNTGPALCSMGGSSNCLPGNAWITCEKQHCFGGNKNFLNSLQKRDTFKCDFFTDQYSNVSENSIGYHRIQR